jgi:hypothetical protein
MKAKSKNVKCKLKVLIKFVKQNFGRVPQRSAEEIEAHRGSSEHLN